MSWFIAMSIPSIQRAFLVLSYDLKECDIKKCSEFYPIMVILSLPATSSACLVSKSGLVLLDK